MASISKNFVGDVFTVGIKMGDVIPKLTMLGDRLGAAVMRRGLLSGARVIGQEARSRAPKPAKGKGRGKGKKKGRRKTQIAWRGNAPAGTWATGNLARTLVWQTRGVFRDGSGKPVGHRAVVIINPKKGKRNARWYAHFVEYGTEPHAVGKGSISRVFKRSKRSIIQLGRTHPGARPRPFMRPAFDAKSAEALQTIVDTAREQADIELRRVAQSMPIPAFNLAQ